MATFTKRDNSKWQAKCRKKGFKTQSKTFSTKAMAVKWARETEVAMEQGIFVSTAKAENTSVKDASERYWVEKVSKTRSAQSYRYPLDRLQDSLGHFRMIDISVDMIRDYKHYRLEKVSGETVRKELMLFRRMVKFAQEEWDIYLPKGNCALNVSLPEKSAARDRRLKEGEEKSLLEAAKTYGGSIHDIIVLAIETGMRRSEIVRLQWRYVDLEKKTAYLPETKNGEPRKIPLSPIAASVLERQIKESETIFDIRPDSIGQAFRRVRARAGISGLRFHDLRHEATTRFFELGLPIMEVSAITGHKDLAMLKRYTHLKAEDLAEKLAQKLS